MMKTMDELISWFQLKYPKLVRMMKDCNHHLDEKNLNPWHIEGDVFTHTLMVCMQARHSSPVVQLAALLHDIGKPFTREVKNDRVRFFNHEPVSAMLSLEILKDVDWIDEEEKIQVFRAVAHHTDPFKLTGEQLSELFTNEPFLSQHVKELSACDQLGKFTLSEGRDKEFSCNFKTIKEKKEKEMTILVGLPCSGKSTRAKKLFSEEYEILSSDEIIEMTYPNLTYDEAYCKMDKKELTRLFDARMAKLKASDKVVVDTTNLTKKRRRRIIEHFKSTHNIKCEVFLTPLSVLADRNLNRKGKYIPSNVFDDMIKSFYPPTLSEGFSDIEWRLK